MRPPLRTDDDRASGTRLSPELVPGRWAYPDHRCSLPKFIEGNKSVTIWAWASPPRTCSATQHRHSSAEQIITHYDATVCRAVCDARGRAWKPPREACPCPLPSQLRTPLFPNSATDTAAPRPSHTVDPAGPARRFSDGVTE